MKPTLSDHDRRRLDARVAEAEKRTGIQIVLSVIRRSDSYAELPWKAFALGASAAGLILFLLYGSSFDWYPDVTPLLMVTGILASGAAFALLGITIPRFAKFFLPDSRAEVEVRQYAKTLFLDRELFATQGRRGILLLVSLFEHRVVILPDKWLAQRLTEEHVRNMIAAMTPLLKRKQVTQAFDAGLDYLSGVLTTASPEIHGDELPNAIIEEEGI